MDELRVNAALVELNALIQSLTQRCMNLSGELAVAQDKIKKLETPVETDRNVGNDDN